MNRHVSRYLSATAFIVLANTGLSTGVLAQLPGAAPSRAGGFGMGQRQFGSFVDPSHSAIEILVRRDDVRSQILLSAKQLEALNGADKQMQQQIGQKMRDAMSALQSASPQERQAKLQEMQSQAKLISAEYQASQDKKIEAILKPDQWARLRELDLQWRGPMSLSDKKVGEPFRLTTDQRTKVEAALKQCQDTQRNAIMAGIGSFTNGAPGKYNRTTGGPPASGAAPGNATKGGGGGSGFSIPLAEEVQKRMAEFEKLTQTALRTGNTRVLAMLTQDQKQRWDKALGKPFAFRTNQ